MLLYQKRKIVEKMYGDQVLDLENPKAMKRLMTIRKVSAIVGAKEKTVSKFLQMYLKYGELERPVKRTGRPKKLPAALVEWLVSREALTNHRYMTMQQRCDDILHHTEPPLKISKSLLLKVYRDHKVVRRKASFKFNRRLNSENAQTHSNIVFLYKLLRHMHEKRQIIYMDETSTHLWEKMKSFWMPSKELIDVRLNRERGKSVTIIGGISLGFDKLEYITCGSTNCTNFHDFLHHISDKIDKKNTVMVLDNHAAHRSKTSVNLANRLGIHLEFLPPTASELNPIERMWSYFKRRWRQKLYNPSYHITSETSVMHIE